MRLAALISGWPRFCSDFDSQLAALAPYDVDWYCAFWHPGGQAQDSKVSPSWNPRNPQEAAEWIQRRLPSTHKIKLLELVNPEHCPPPPRSYQGFYCSAEGVHAQYSILQHVFWRQQQAGLSYDLVLRTRPDRGLVHFDLDAAHQLVQQQSNLLILPRNERRGTHNFCDQFALGQVRSMALYCSVILHFDTAHRLQGVPYNPEYLVGHILSQQGLVWPPVHAFELVKEQQGVHTPGKFTPVWGQWE